MTSPTPTNRAAYLPHAKAPSTQVLPAPYPTTPDDEADAASNQVIIIRVHSLAINPMDHMIQDQGDSLFSFLKYPYIGGADVAGTVVSCPSPSSSSKTQTIKPGDRVLALADCLSPLGGAFQEYVVVKPQTVTKIPDSLSFQEACVLPLGLCTAAAGLYEKGSLGLEYPTVEKKREKQEGEGKGKEKKKGTVLIWAGSSSVGSNAIQLAVASGYDVLTTCSPRNFEFCEKGLGARKAFDYKSPTLVKDLVGAFENKTCVGAFALLEGSTEVCLEVLDKVEGNGGNKFMAAAVRWDEGKVPEGVKVGGVLATTIVGNEISEVIFGQFLPKALEEGKYACVPEAMVVGTGLESVQLGVDTLRKGVSAKKVVINL